MRFLIFILLASCLAAPAWSAVPVTRVWTTNQIKAVQKKAEEGDSVAEEILGYFYIRGFLGAHKVPVNPEPEQPFIRKEYTLPSLEDVLPRLGNVWIDADLHPPIVGIHIPDTEHELAPDYATAVDWFRKSAEQGNDFAQCHLAVLYAKGKGVKQDYAEAVEWLKKATTGPNARAEYYLAHMYLEGKGVPESGPEAAKWLLKAAKTYHDAQVDLGLLYGIGRPDFPQNYKEAAYWFHVANADARLFESHLTSSDKEEIKARHLKWYDDYKNRYNTRVPPPDYEEHPPKWLPAE